MYLFYSEEEIQLFQQNLENIIFSKDIKRLKSKTQLFSSNTGDHYRNRLTHTLEVTIISKEIAIQAEKILESKFNSILKGKKIISLDLIEAIAYGHDLGHTPFGHVGEKTLQKILQRKDDLGNLIFDNSVVSKSKDYNLWLDHIEKSSFFKHNVNSVKILLKNGITNWRILDGVLKHTDISYERSSEIPTAKLNWLKFLLKGLDLGDKYFKGKERVSSIPLTLEGQIVAIADEIAQIYSDLDDTLRYNKILKLSNMLCIENMNESMRKNNEQLLKEIKNIFISEVISEFEKKMDTYVEKIKSIEDLSDYFSLCQNSFFYFAMSSEETEESIEKDINNNLNNKVNLLEKSTLYKAKFITKLKRKYALSSEKIRMSDAKSRFVIRQLFKAYYNNYNLLNDKILDFIIKEYNQLTKANTTDLNVCIERMKEINSQTTIAYDIFLIGNILLTSIANHIADMTDDYALEEYKKIYL